MILSFKQLKKRVFTTLSLPISVLVSLILWDLCNLIVAFFTEVISVFKFVL